MGADVTTLNETTRATLDGTEYIRLATTGSNWKALTGNQTWVFLGIAGGTAAGSTLTLESTTGTGTSDFISFKTGSQLERERIDTNGIAIFNTSGTPLGNLSTSGNFNVQVVGPLSGRAAVATFNYGNTGWYPQFSFCKSISGTVGTIGGALTTGLNIGELSFAGDNGTDFYRGCSIYAQSDGAWSSTSTPGVLIFKCTGAGVLGTEVNIAERMRLDSVGILTIGGAAAQISDGTSILGLLQIQGTSSATASMAVQRWSADVNSSNILLTKSRGASIGTQTAVSSGDSLGAIFFNGSDGTGLREAANIIGAADAAPATSTTPGRLVLQTTPAGTSQTPVEALRLDSSQNVNIGNKGAMLADALGNTPQLQVSATHDTFDLRRYSADANPPTVSSAKSHNATVGTNTAVSSGDGLLQVVSGGYDATGTPVLRNAADIIFEADAAPTAGSVPGRIRFRSCPSGSTTLTEAFRIDANQNVIVGTAALATNATNGFLYIDSCAGVPSGTPTSYSGRVPIIYDTTDDRIYAYDGSWLLHTDAAAWTQTTPTPTPGAGSFTATCTLRRKQIGKVMHLSGQVNVTANASGTGDINIPLPVNAASSGNTFGVFSNVSNGTVVGYAAANSATNLQLRFGVGGATLGINVYGFSLVYDCV